MEAGSRHKRMDQYALAMAIRNVTANSFKRAGEEKLLERGKLSSSGSARKILKDPSTFLR